MKNYDKGSEWGKWDLHVHTASSYDYKYKGEDSDKLLCKALKDNDIVAAAITDHFVIDKDRINNLRTIAPDITFFPGVELRTDKGASNVHVILIFPETCDIDILTNDFDAIMIRQNAKSAESDDTIYWTYEHIVEFAKSHSGLISIHAGNKRENGIDKEITNALPVGQAIKKDIAETVDFFEIGKKSHIDDYNNHVFNFIDEKPLIICSDNHDSRNYIVKENLWIKANPTFEGLLQCLYQPKERVFIGIIPPSLDRVIKNMKSNISEIKVCQIENPKNTITKWFDFSLSLNTGLIAIIGNKGSGKSALSDIVGHLCKCSTMTHASFLNQTRFRKQPKNYANDYMAEITWNDKHTEEILLSVDEYETSIENAQYLPQKFIEEVCNDIDSTFQKEIDKVIFSYVDKTERGSAKNLQELVSIKANALNIAIQKSKNELTSINKNIIMLEDKKTSQYFTSITDSLKKMEETLERHNHSRPVEVLKPIENDQNIEYQKQLNSSNEIIKTTEEKLAENRKKLTEINSIVDETKDLIARIDVVNTDIKEVNFLIEEFVSKHSLENANGIEFNTPTDRLNEFLGILLKQKSELQENINGTEQEDGLIQLLEKANSHKEQLISNTDVEEKKYQKYLSDLLEWDKQKSIIIGTKTTEDTLEYFKNEKLFLEEEINNIYSNLKSDRNTKIKEMFDLKLKLMDIYKEIYSPIENEIKKLLGDLDENVEFVAEIKLSQPNFAETLLSYINKNYVGVFKGKTESQNKMNTLIRKTEFSNIESVFDFINEVLMVTDESIDDSNKKISNKQEFYDLICSLDFIDVSYNLRMGGRELDELSPGERGIVLLIFYLALSQNNIPIIIDQPEDNLDNQSVFSKLVPCICAAKKKRQVIIVTHNPNIAIACDAEQIIFCDMDKSSHTINYISGAIENHHIRQHVIDVLEGTMPAFDLRKRKYLT